MKICFATYRAVIPAIWLWPRGDIWKRRQWVEAAQLQASVLPPPDSDPERARSLWRSQFTPLRNGAYARLSWGLIAVKLSERDGMYICCYFAIKISKRIVRGERLNKENGTAEAALISVTWTPGLSSVCQWPYWVTRFPHWGWSSLRVITETIWNAHKHGHLLSSSDAKTKYIGEKKIFFKCPECTTFENSISCCWFFFLILKAGWKIIIKWIMSSGYKVKT